MQTAHYFSTEQTSPGAFSLNFFAVVCDRVSGIFTSPRGGGGVGGAHHRKNKTISFTRQPKDKISSNPLLLRPLLNLDASKNQIQNKLTFGCDIVGPWVVLWSSIAGQKIVTSLIIAVTTLLIVVTR